MGESNEDCRWNENSSLSPVSSTSLLLLDASVSSETCSLFPTRKTSLCSSTPPFPFPIRPPPACFCRSTELALAKAGGLSLLPHLKSVPVFWPQNVRMGQHSQRASLLLLVALNQESILSICLLCHTPYLSTEAILFMPLCLSVCWENIPFSPLQPVLQLGSDLV